MNWSDYQKRAARTLSRKPLSSLSVEEFKLKLCVMGSRIFLAPGIVILVGDWRTSAELAHVVGFSTEAA